MGYRLNISPEQGGDSWTLHVTVGLDRVESNELFLSGDRMVSWPIDGLEERAAPGLERSSMFISEVASRAEGIRLRYLQFDQAKRAEGLLRTQLARQPFGSRIQSLPLPQGI